MPYANAVPPTFHPTPSPLGCTTAVAPTVRAPSQLLGAPLGSDVQLNCQVEASPAPVTYWLKGGRMPVNSFTGSNGGGGGGAGAMEIAHPRPEMLLDGYVYTHTAVEFCARKYIEFKREFEG